MPTYQIKENLFSSISYKHDNSFDIVSLIVFWSCNLSQDEYINN